MANALRKYRKASLEFVLSLLDKVYFDELEFDKILNELSEDVLKEVLKILEELIEDGELFIDEETDLDANPKVSKTIQDIIDNVIPRLDYLDYMGYLIITDSLIDTYKDTFKQTYVIFSPYLMNNPNYDTAKFDFNKYVLSPEITDTYITNNYLKIPWCQDGKVYSQRLYGHVANFESKLAFVLQEGITNGKGFD